MKFKMTGSVSSAAIKNWLQIYAECNPWIISSNCPLGQRIIAQFKPGDKVNIAVTMTKIRKRRKK